MQHDLRSGLKNLAGPLPEFDETLLPARRPTGGRRRQFVLICCVLIAVVGILAVRGGSHEVAVVESSTVAPSAAPGNEQSGPFEAEWAMLPESPLSPRFNATAEWTGDEFVVWGGYAEGGTLMEGPAADGAAYNPSTRRWRPIAPAPVPGAHRHHSLWTGSEVWIAGGFGGDTGRDPTTAAAAYAPSTDTWRILPDMPESVVSLAWVGDAAVALSSSGGTYSLRPTDDAWAEVRDETPDRRSSVDGPEALLLIGTDGSASVVSGAAGQSLQSYPLPGGVGDLLGADPRSLGISGPPGSIVLVGPAGTFVEGEEQGAGEVSGVRLAWPVDLVNMDAETVVAVARDGSSIHSLDRKTMEWQPIPDAPRQEDLRGSAIAAGGRAVFIWGGSTENNLPNNDGILLQSVNESVDASDRPGQEEE